MIQYRRFWENLHKSRESTYTLIKSHHISSSTIDKLRKNKPVNTTTINDLCRILECRVEDIMEYVPSEEDQNYKITAVQEKAPAPLLLRRCGYWERILL